MMMFGRREGVGGVGGVGGRWMFRGGYLMTNWNLSFESFVPEMRSTRSFVDPSVSAGEFVIYQFCHPLWRCASVMCSGEPPQRATAASTSMDVR